MPVGISKVKALPACAPAMLPAGCILPRTAPGQWEMSVQAFFARTRGTVQWPRNNWWAGGWANREVDFNDDLQLPAHQVLAQFTAKYQFRPQWAIRYSILGLDLKGGGWNWNNWNQFYFGNQFFGGTNNINSEWQHLYQRVGVLYDAIRTCNSAVSIFTDWVHADDKITVGCGFCGWGASTLSKGTDAAIVGLEIERCMSTAWNGGTFSCDYKAGVIFLDDVEGVDAQAGCKYSIPMNYGRWGFVKGGYRYVELKKTQQDYLLKHALEGGFMELGVIF
jgi:hypothetical protein